MLSQTDAFDIEANYYVWIAGFVLLCYDYVLTFRREIYGFWSPMQFGWGTTIFLLNRYVTILGHIPIIAEIFFPGFPETICHTFQSYHQYLSIVIQIIIGVIMITRTYALWGCSRKILLFLMMLSAAVLAFGAWTLFSGTSEPPISVVYPGMIGYYMGLSSNQGHREVYSIAPADVPDQIVNNTGVGEAWAGMVLFDSTIFALTIYKSLKLKQRGQRRLVDVLLRDGAVYFAVMSLTTSCNVLTYMVGRPFTSGIMTPIMNAFSSVGATRLMLNIRRRGQTVLVHDSSSTPTANATTMPSIRFAPAIADPESSYPPERQAANEIEEPRQGDLELSPLGEPSRIRFTA